MTDMVHYRGYSTRAQVDAEEGVIFGRVLGIGPVIGFHGQDMDEFKTTFAEAVDEYLADCEQDGVDPDKPYSGKVMFRVRPEVHRAAVIAAELQGRSLNDFAEQALVKAATDATHEGVVLDGAR